MGMLDGCATCSVGRAITHPFLFIIHDFIILHFPLCSLPYGRRNVKKKSLEASRGSASGRRIAMPRRCPSYLPITIVDLPGGRCVQTSAGAAPCIVTSDISTYWWATPPFSLCLSTGPSKRSHGRLQCTKNVVLLLGFLPRVHFMIS